MRERRREAMAWRGRACSDRLGGGRYGQSSWGKNARAWRGCRTRWVRGARVRGMKSAANAFAHRPPKPAEEEQGRPSYARLAHTCEP